MKNRTLRISKEELEKRKAYYDKIYRLYKNSSLEELKTVFDDKNLIRGSTARHAIATLANELFLKQKDNINELKEIDNE